MRPESPSIRASVDPIQELVISLLTASLSPCLCDFSRPHLIVQGLRGTTVPAPRRDAIFLLRRPSSALRRWLSYSGARCPPPRRGAERRASRRGPPRFEQPRRAQRGARQARRNEPHLLSPLR